MRLRLATLGLGVLLMSACAVPSDSGPAGHRSAEPGIEAELPRKSVLLYDGAGTWGPERASLANNLEEHGIAYQAVDSEKLNAMTLEEISGFGLLIVPGGDANVMIASLAKTTQSRLRKAVREQGVGFLGFCAGAWMAVSPNRPEDEVEYGLGLIDAPVQEQTRMGKEGKHWALDRATFADGTHRELLWYGGPITPAIPGGVVARYSDGTPAITQARAGKGLVLISGLHPTATVSILRSLGFGSTEAVAPDLTWKMIAAALGGKGLIAN